MPEIINRNIFLEDDDTLVLSHDEKYESGKIRNVKYIFKNNKITKFVDGEPDFEWDGANNVLHVPKPEFCPLCGAITKEGENNGK